MSFGKKLLEKYGWSEGQGLGKENQGVSKPISALTQTTTKGIGTCQASFVNWWDDLYSNTLSRINSINSINCIENKAPQDKLASKEKKSIGKRKEKKLRKQKDKKREGKVKKIYK